MSNIVATLTELAQAEISLHRAYGRAMFLAANGVLRERDRVAVHAARDEVFAIEMALVDQVRPLLASVGLEEYLPQPQRLPDLPPTATPPTLPTGTAGLGNPLYVGGLFAVALIAVVQTVAQAWVVTRFINVSGTLVTNIFRARENSKRIDRQLEVQQERFIECLRQTRDPGRCAETFPLPTPPLEQEQAPPQDPIAIGIGIGAAVAIVGVTGWLGWQAWSMTGGFASSSSRPRKLSEREVTRRLSA